MLPVEVISTTADGVDATESAVSVPESAAVDHCTVVGPHVIVTVVRGEHHSILPNECVTAYITRVPGYPQSVVGCLTEYNEGTVLGVVPGAISMLQVKSQLVESVRSQLTEQVVAEPVVASRVVESDFKLRP